MKKACQFLFPLLLFLAAGVAQEKASRLTVEARDGKQTVFSVEQLRKMPRQTVSATDAHTGASHQYEGVLLSALLAAAGVPSGEALRGAELRDYVEAVGADNYTVIFSLPELDSLFQDNKVIVADMQDGKPLDAAQGPLKLIVPQDRRPARWVRMLVNISVHQAP